MIEKKKIQIYVITATNKLCSEFYLKFICIKDNIIREGWSLYFKSSVLLVLKNSP